MSGAESQFAGVTGTVLITGAGGFFRFVGNHNGANAIFDMTGSSASVSSAGNGAVPNPTIHVGALIGDSTATFGATAGATYIMGARNLSTTFTGNFGAVADNLIKVGTGTFTLGGTYGWTGSTTVSNGVLALLEPTSLDSSPTLRLGSSAAVIDVSGRTDGTLNLGSVAAQTLSGIGAIRGSVNQNAGSTITVGLGTLNITNVATLNGALVMQLNRTNGITASKLTAQSFVNASELTVTNLGPDLATGDSFQLFNVPMTGFTAVNLPAANAANTIPYVWTNRLHIDGSIQVLSGASAVNPNPGKILSSVSGNVLSLSWPTNSGWTLQIQTNSLSTGLSTNWVDVPGSTAITSTNITLDPARPAIFYRLKL
jgi:autotransporter-associated beta strand protein